MKNHKEIIKTRCDAAIACINGEPGWRGRFEKEKQSAWDAWEEAVKNGFDTKKFGFAPTERERFEFYLNGLINNGF